MEVENFQPVLLQKPASEVPGFKSFFKYFFGFTFPPYNEDHVILDLSNAFNADTFTQMRLIGNISRKQLSN